MDKKVIIEDGDILNSVELTIKDENHTLGNLLSDYLYRDKRCVFSAYKMPHPLTEEIKIKVTTDGSIKPVDLIVETIDKLNNEIIKLYRKVEEYRSGKVDN